MSRAAVTLFCVGPHAALSGAIATEDVSLPQPCGDRGSDAISRAGTGEAAVTGALHSAWSGNPGGPRLAPPR